MGSTQKSQDSQLLPLKASWSVDLKLTHLDWSPEATLIHFQGQYQAVCELEYSILQGELHNAPKTKAALDIGDFCLVEDSSSGRWHRGRVQGLKEDHLLDVFLIDHGNILSVGASHVSSCPDHLLSLPPKIVCGFLSNVLLFTGSSSPVMQDYFSTLLKTNVKGHIKALLPHKVLLLEVPEVNSDIVLHGLGRHVDTNTFLLLVEMLTEIPLNSDLVNETCRNGTQASGLQGPILSFCGPRLSCGTRVDMRVTAAFHPGLFYCQVTSGDSELWVLSQKLAEVCANRNNVMMENLGSLCSVKHKDGRWYRGFVQLVALNSQVRVWFIDYGFFELVKVENLQSLPPDLYSSPLMALPCSLCSCDPGQLGLLKAGILGDVLDVEINDYDEVKHVYTVRAVKVQDGRETNPQQEPCRIKTETQAAPPFCHLVREEKITEQLLNIVFREERIHVSSSFVGYVEHVQNPNNFWIRSQKRNKEFEEMMKKLYDHYSDETDTLSNPEIGALCGALYMEDRHFYRGVVVDILQHEAKVLFIDFGNVGRVPHKLIKKIPEMFASIPPFALRCSLCGVFPPGELWTASNSSEFSQLTSNKEIEIHVVQIRKKSLLVHLCDGKQRISELMVSTQNASFQDRPSPRGLAPNRHSDSQLKDHKQHVGGQDDESPSGLQRLSTKPNSSVSETFVYSSFDLSPGSEEEVYVSHLSSQWEVFCQLRRNISMIEELEQNILEETSKQGLGDVVEKLCLAKYLDGNWYRGFTSPVLSPRHLAVFFVDYGNAHIYERSSIKFIRRDSCLLHVPMQAVKFMLASVPREELYPDVRPWLERTILNKWVRAVVRGEGDEGSFNVELFDGDVNINEEVNKLILGLSPKIMTVRVKTHKPLTQNVGAVRKKSATKAPKPPEKHRSPKHVKESNKSNTNSRRSPTTRGRRSPGQGGTRPGDKSTKTQQPQSASHNSVPDKKVDAGRKECFVSHSHSVDHFFLQLADDEAAILDMNEKLNASRSSFLAASSVKVGDAVLVTYDEDDALYRAVVKAEEASEFRVEFVDYGNSSVVEKEKIFALPTSYLHQPRWSIQCALLDASAYASDASFSDAVAGKLLVVEFVEQLQSRWKVKIEVIEEEEASTAEAPVEETAENQDSADDDPAVTHPDDSVETGAVEAAAPCWDIKAGDSEDGVILSVLSNGDFYFRLDRSSDWAAHQESCIAERIFACEKMEDVDVDVNEGVKCLVQVHGSWRRAEVLHVHGPECRVDEGVAVETSCGSLRQQWSPLVDVPNVAVLCRTRRGDLTEQENSQEPCRGTSELVCKEVQLKFVCYSEAEKLWLVQLVSSEPMSDVPLEDSPLQRLSFAPVVLDKSYRGFVSACVSPSHFCVVLEASLLTLTSVFSLTEGFSGDSPSLPEAHVRPGVSCMFESDSKTKWCRAEIVHVGSELLLDLVDYGHRESLPYLDSLKLQRLPDQLLNLPRLMYPCTLRGVQPAGQDEEWSEDAVAFFQHLTWADNLQISFRESPSNTRRSMVDVVADGVQVAHELVLAGQAGYIDPLLLLRTFPLVAGDTDQSEVEEPAHEECSDVTSMADFNDNSVNVKLVCGD